MANNSSNATSNKSVDFIHEISATEYQVTAVLITCLIIATVVGNFMVILCFILERSIRTFNNVFILSLAIADLLVGVIIMPLTLVFDLTGRWAFGGPMCDAWQYLDAVCCCCSILNLCAISMVRYLSITHPLKYSSVIKTPEKGLMIIGLVWVLALLLNSPTLFGWQFRHAHLKCVVRKNHIVYIIYSALTTYFLPLGLILFASVSIIVALRKSRRKVGILPPKLRQTNHDGVRASIDVSSCATTTASNADRSCFNMSNAEGNVTGAGTSTSRNVLSPNVFVTTSSAKGPSLTKSLLTPSARESTQVSPLSTQETILTPTTLTSASAAPSPSSSNNGNLTSQEESPPRKETEKLTTTREPSSETKRSSGPNEDSIESIDIEVHDYDSNPSGRAKMISVGIVPLEDDSAKLTSLGGGDNKLTSVESAVTESKCLSIFEPREDAASMGAAHTPSQHLKESLLDESSVDESQDGSQSHKSLKAPNDTAISKPRNYLSPPSVLTSSDRPPSPSNSAGTPTPGDLDIAEMSPSVVISEPARPSEKADDSKQDPDSATGGNTGKSHSQRTEDPSKTASPPNIDKVNFLTPSAGLKPPDRSPSPCSSTDANYLSAGVSAPASRPISPSTNSVSAVRLSFISKAETVIQKDSKIGVSDVRKTTDSLSMRVLTAKFNQLKVTTDVVIGGNRMTGKTGTKARHRLRDLRERRAVKSLAVIAVFFTVCWTPFYFVYVVAHFCNWCSVPRYVMTLTIWLGYSNSCLNPILYTVFNSAFKEAFVSIWSRIKSKCKVR